MREIYRTIVSAVIFSKDGKILMGKKDPAKGGVYPDAWHIPGGGVDEGETLEEALHREVLEEVGIDTTTCRVVPIDRVGNGTSEKTLKTGERVLCHMEFHYFEVHDDEKDATGIEVHRNDDLVETKWFSKAQLQHIEQVPGGAEFFKEMGYM